MNHFIFEPRANVTDFAEEFVVLARPKLGSNYA
jgi:hypothetical protein